VTSHPHPPRAGGVTGLVLAGGRARRMGGADKGLVPLAGRPMVCWVSESLAGQCEQVMVNANRNADRYRELTGLPVLADTMQDFAGPLAGMASGLAACTTEWMATAPCDSPLIAPDLVARLRAALDADGADLAVAHDGERMQPVFALLPTRLLPSLREFLDGGGRKIDQWYAAQRTALASFEDRPRMFLNVNTPEERERLEAALAGGGLPA